MQTITLTIVIDEGDREDADFPDHMVDVELGAPIAGTSMLWHVAQRAAVAAFVEALRAGGADVQDVG